MGRRTVYGFAALALACFGIASETTSAGATLAPPTPCVGCYVPAATTSWQIQLNGTVSLTANATLYDIDGFDNTAATVAKLHAQGRKVACYFSAGSFENWRPDAASFPGDVKGANNGWPGEKWLDIRRLDVLGPIIESRLDMCKAKGFDSADPDNVDGFTNTTGFPLTPDDQLAFNTFVANAAHARGLSVALKNDLAQIPELVAYFDWSLTSSATSTASATCSYRSPQRARPSWRSSTRH